MIKNITVSYFLKLLGLVSLNETRKDDLQTKNIPIIEIMITCLVDSKYLNSDNQEYAKNGALFWPEFLTSAEEMESGLSILEPYLPNLLNNLMEGLILTEEDIMNQLPTENQKDQEQPDFFENTEFTLRRLSG